MSDSEHERRLAPLKRELIDLSYKVDQVPIGSQEWRAANERLTQLTKELAKLDGEFSRQRQN